MNFHHKAHNISDDELVQARYAYTLIRDLFIDKKEITKQNVMKGTPNVWRTNFFPFPLDQLTMDCVLRLILLSQQFYPPPSLVLTGTVRGMTFQRAQSLFEFFCLPYDEN